MARALDLFAPFNCVKQEVAQQAFDLLAAASCSATSPAPGCIPYRFPDGGALGRAHEACRRLRQAGRKPRKVWIQGARVVATRNTPDCAVQLSLNVAPTVCVRRPGSFFRSDTKVLDPTFFTAPVLIAEWKAAHSDDNATITETSADVFDLVQGFTDPSFELTADELNAARAALLARNAQDGPPPYAACP